MEGGGEILGIYKLEPQDIEVILLLLKKKTFTDGKLIEVYGRLQDKES